MKQNDDMELVAVFTRRDPKSLQVQTPGLQVQAGGFVCEGEKGKSEVKVKGKEVRCRPGADGLEGQVRS